ncbi:MAG: PHP domain-containing protein [Minicystis sp.]
MRRILPLAALVVAAPNLLSCNDHQGLLSAKKVEDRAELVGGPVAMADLGDFLLQNDKIKVNILAPKDSPGPGVFGGSIVDVDVRRDLQGFEGGQGRDRFAEMFPVTNLLVPFPKDPADVKVLKDGSDGKEAAIRVEGKGAFLFEALAILRDQAPLLGLLFPGIKTEFRFRTDYILRPGERHIVIRTTVMLDEAQDESCPDISTCPVCENGYVPDENTGCLSCTCADVIPLEPYTKSYSVFGQIFGDLQSGSTPPVNHAGVVAGDFVFFGNQNNVFAPGIGFDTDKAVHDAFYAGRNTFQDPLSFDFVTAAGGDVSYGYFTVPPEGSSEQVRVNVPIFTSAATAFLAAGKSCLFDTSDDETCDNKRAFTFERYLAVGDGDIASVSDEVWKTRGTPTGEIRGEVRWQSTGEPSPKARVYVFQNPVPGRGWRDLDELVDANLRTAGNVGIVNEIDADVGVDRTLDGDFHATIPPGDYVVVARTEDGMGFSQPQSIKVTAGKTTVVIPAVITPGTIEYRVFDERGEAVPAKIAFVSIDERGEPLYGDGTRRVYLGDTRLGNGNRAIEYAASGAGTTRLEPGRYRFRASRGPEYGMFEQDIVVEAGGVQRVDATLVREVDTTGWMSTDMHIHSTPSFDSGMPLPRRLSTVVAEHVEFAVPTDHDVQTDYEPTIHSMLLEPHVATAVGVETTTIEQGHFIAFPLKYDETIVPTHGSHDPTCESGGQIISALKARGAEPSYEPFTILAHPRDGFFGYMYQLGVDPFTMKRKTGTLEANNPVFKTATCDFDGMELINGKRFDLVRTATISEVVDWNRCLTRLDGAKNPDALATVCPEISSTILVPCAEGERFVDCKDKNRTALAWQSMKRILARTPEEQEALWGFSMTMVDGQALCDLKKFGNDPVPAEDADMPCTHYSGHVDDYFRYLEHGMLKTHVASSDSHSPAIEPGSPRTYFMSPTDSPAALAPADVVDSLKNGHALTTYGPFITASVDGKTFGDTVKVTAGGKATLDLTVQTASWFGVDRIEIYQNGHLVKLPEVKSKTEDIIDFQGKIDLDVPQGRDSWIVIIAMGLEDRNLMRKGSLDMPFGEIQISKVTADAFALIPVVNGFFAPTPTVPDWFPIPAYAVSNPIYLDANGNGKYDPPLPYPEFCSQPCDVNGTEAVCSSDQVCLADASQCGVPVIGKCEHRIPWKGGEAPGEQ